MKKTLSILLLLVGVLATFSSCFVSNQGAKARKPTMHFTTERGEQRTLIYLESGDNIMEEKFAPWDRPSVYATNSEGGEVVIKIEKEETLLQPTGMYKLDAGWVQFYYPKTKHFLQVVVQPNAMGKKRTASLWAPSHIEGLQIYITQDP